MSERIGSTSRLNEIYAVGIARDLVESAKTDLASLGSLGWGDFPLGVNPSTETWFEHLSTRDKGMAGPSEGTTGYEEEWSD